jgi:hypothetical protein
MEWYKNPLNFEKAQEVGSEVELRDLDAVIKYGTQAKAAEALGKGSTPVGESMIRLKRKIDYEDDLPRTHLIIPDTQVKPGVPTNHLDWIGAAIVDYMPDVVVHIGDHADMPSLSSYDKGKKSFEGRRYADDIKSARDAMAQLVKPLEDYNKNKVKKYKPELIITLGNHENRINRAIDAQAELEGVIGITGEQGNSHFLNYHDFGFEVVDFLKIKEVDGVSYCHYFYNPMNGRPYGGASIDARLKNIGFTFVMGHQQGYKMGMISLNNGQTIRGIVAGSCYLHEEDYIGPQANKHWHGILILHEVKDGNFCVMELSMDYLCRKYEGISLKDFKQIHNIEE